MVYLVSKCGARKSRQRELEKAVCLVHGQEPESNESFLSRAHFPLPFHPVHDPLERGRAAHSGVSAYQLM